MLFQFTKNKNNNGLSQRIFKFKIMEQDFALLININLQLYQKSYYYLFMIMINRNKYFNFNRFCSYVIIMQLDRIIICHFHLFNISTPQAYQLLRIFNFYLQLENQIIINLRLNNYFNQKLIIFLVQFLKVDSVLQFGMLKHKIWK